MIPIEDMLNIICTEASEDCDPPTDRKPSELPALQFDLELIRLPDGKLEWVD